MSNTINYSSEMMTNYLQASIMAPDATFEVLQNNLGNALLFSIGTDSVFYVTYESPSTPGGWTRLDLSSTAMAEKFTGGTCKKMSVAQNIVDGTIGLAMIVTVSGADYLMLCMGNSNSDMSWLSAPMWVYAGYDATTTTPSPFLITNVFISETLQGQFIVADLDNNGIVDRFYIVPNGKPWWNMNSLRIDLNTNNYMGCIGRASIGGPIDGMYTGGSIDGAAQLVYSPVYNYFGNSAPSSSPLYLPSQLVPQAMASFRNGSSNDTTDLLVTAVANGTGSLYYFAYDNQSANGTATLLFQHDLLINVSYLQAVLTNGTLTVWGLNGADQLFYLTCPYTLGSPGTWSVQNPLPILTNVDLVSPYINLSNNGNTIFAVAQNTLYILTNSPQTGLWTTKQITLPPPLSTSPSLTYSSYTTTIQLFDENNQPVASSPLLLSSNTRASFYINNLYFVLDTTPIPVNTDRFGNITVIESITDLNGTMLYVSESGGIPTSINPMDTVFNKVAQLNSVSALQNAVITDNDGTTTPLVPPNTSSAGLTAVATANQNLATAYKGFTSPSYTSRAAAYRNLVVGTIPGYEDAILVELGDLYQLLDSAANYIIHIEQDAVSGLWNFIAEIGEAVYQAVLDTVHAVAGAVEWVFNQIVVDIEDLISYLGFLFGWQDILTTHKVMKNVFLQATQQAISTLASFETSVEDTFAAVIKTINGWADLPALGQTANSTTGTNPAPASQNSAPSNLGVYHFQGNVSNASTSYNAPSFSEELFQDLMNLLNQEKDTLSAAYDSIQSEIIVPFATLTATEVIQKFIAIAVDTLLEAAEDVIVEVIKVFVQIADAIVGLMTAPIDFPVISDLYMLIAGEPLSFLDVVCLIAAIPATVCYKLANNLATGSTASPFPIGDTVTNALLNATSFAEIQSAFYTTSTMRRQPTGDAPLSEGATPVLNEEAMKIFGFVTDFFALGGSIVCGVTNTLLKALSLLQLPQPKSLLAINAVGNVAYVSPNLPAWVNVQTDDMPTQMNNILTVISIIKGFSNIFFSSSTTYSDVSSGVESVINLWWNFPVIVTTVENADEATTTYKSLIPAAIGNFAFNLGGILEVPILLADEQPEVYAGLVLAQDGLMVIYGLCMPIAGGIYAFAPNQTVN